MKKKGFTLIETLAVIIILAILSLILTPMIQEIIKSSKKKAFRESVNGVIVSSEYYVSDYIMSKIDDPEYPIVITCNGTTCEAEDGTVITFKGEVPVSGKIILASPGVSIADLISNGYWCGSGEKGNIEVEENCALLDHTSPVIDESRLNDIYLRSTTNSVILTMPMDLMYDNETGIEKYLVSIYDGNELIEEKEYKEPDITFQGLRSGTEYRVIIVGINGNKGRTSIEREVETLSMTNPTIAYTNNPTGERDYYTSQTLNVTYIGTNIESPSYYIRSTRNASTNENVIASCGTGDEPSECSEATGTTIEANTWYKVSGNINAIYNVDASSIATLTALTYDGVNYSGAATGTVAMIDVTGPTTPTGGAIGNVSGSNTTGTIQTEATGSTDAGVGGITYKYLVTNSNTTPSKTDANFTTTKTFARSCGTSYYAWAIAEDSLGNRSEVKALGSTADGANSYSGWSACSQKCGAQGTQTRTNTCALVTTGLSQSCTVGTTYKDTNGTWGACSKTCGGGTQSYTVTRTYYSNQDNSVCSVTNNLVTTSQACNTQSCCIYTANQQVFAKTEAGGYSYTVPAGCGGTYTLQVYGAQGGKVHISDGGAGGYAYGNMNLTAGQTIYIFVGGQGPTCGVSTAAYNGGTGGSGSCDFSRTGDEITGGGGGATHMATTNRGELKNYNSYRGEVIIVAGGGGGGHGYKGWNSDGGYERNTAGGAGGGTSGGTTSHSGSGFGVGGTQATAGGSGGFGYGSSTGGGGGWFGGGQAGNAGAAGGGGSGYLSSSLISGTTGMQNGQKSGAGAAYITFRSLN